MNVSVVICTYNRSALLRQTLEQMRLLEIPAGVSWELLVVDNNSTDDTSGVARSFDGHLPIRVLREERKGRSNALNRSIDEVRSDLVAWTDDDVLVSPGWLRAFVEAAARYPEAAMFGGPVDPWFDTPPDPDILAAFPVVQTGFCGLDHQQPEGPLPETALLVGANMAARLSRVAGIRFDPRLGPMPGQWMGLDDLNFMKAVRERRGQLVWVPGMRVRHYVDPKRLTLPYLREYYEGLGMTFVRGRGMPEGRRLFGAPAWMWRRCAEHGAAALLGRLRSRRVALEQYRDYVRLRGAIRACREITGQR